MTSSTLEQPLTPEQVKAGRALLAWSQAELAHEAHVSPSTIADFERGSRTPVANNAHAIRDALESRGLQFLAGGVVDKGKLPRLPSIRPGSLMRWITATDLAQWGERRDGQSGLPELLRRLVFATLGPAAKVSFPSDESIHHPGWDGLCDADEGTDYVPSGRSVWEIGAQRSRIRAKADEDYDKRSADPLGIVPATASFVFVTPQRFPSKRAWCAEKCASGLWRGVRIIDADDLVHWLEMCPAVAQWLAVLIRRRPRGLRNLPEAWDEWRRATRVPLSADIMLTDRDEDAAEVLKWLQRPPAQLAVQASSVDEAIAFLQAALDPLPEGHRLAYVSRCLVATDAATARELIGIGTPLIVVLQQPEPGLAQSLVADGHHVYAAYGPDVHAAGAMRELARPWRHNLQNALSRMGVSDEDAHRLSRASGRSLAVLRRLMPAAPSHLPPWAVDTPPDLIVAMMAGSWSENSAADRRVIAVLAGRSYEAVEGSLASLVGGPEPPLLRSGPIWKLVSLRDAWTILAPRMTATQLGRFETAFHKVLSARNPRFNLAGRETWFEREGQFGDEVSSELRRGLIETMIALGVYPEAARSIDNGSQCADRAIRKLLGGADAELWWSLSNDFCRLAEASPEAFLNAVEDGLDSAAQPIMSLFRSDAGLMRRTEYLSDLLWALEILARSPEFLRRAALLLARLDSVDPGGQWGNRPEASLRRIFVSWSPQTYASPQQRLKVIDAVVQQYPQVGWNLLVKLAPRHYDTSEPSALPDWRDFALDEREVLTWATVREASRAIGHRLLEQAGLDIMRWQELLKHWASFDTDWRVAATRRLGEAVRRLNDPADRESMRDALRHLLAKHRGFADADWAIPETDLVPLEAIFESLKPQSPEDRHRWLFKSGLPYRADAAWDVLQAEQEVCQRKAAAELLAELDLDELLGFAQTVTMHHALGLAIARAGVDPAIKDRALQVSLRSPRATDGEVANSIMLGLAYAGEISLQALWKRAVAEAWGSDALLRIARALPADAQTWAAVAEVSAELEEAYWRTLAVFQIPAGGLTEEAFRKLLGAGRAGDLLGWLVQQSDDRLPACLVIQALEEAARGPAPTDSNVAVMLGYHVGQLLNHLEADPSVSEDKLVHLEWIYFQALRHSQRPPRTLHHALARNPQFFVDLLRMIFLPAADSGVTEGPPADSEQAKTQARQAYDVLHDWADVPGADSQGLIDAAALEDWVRRARKLLAQAGRGDIGDQRIGEILAASARQPDEPWPPQAVREVIEVSRSRNLETGLEMGVYNRRGVTVRMPNDGGEQERNLAQRYRRDAEALRFDWPRTAAVLDRIAENYGRDAQREDQGAEQRDWQ